MPWAWHLLVAAKSASLFEILDCGSNARVKVRKSGWWIIKRGLDENNRSRLFQQATPQYSKMHSFESILTLNAYVGYILSRLVVFAAVDTCWGSPLSCTWKPADFARWARCNNLIYFLAWKLHSGGLWPLNIYGDQCVQWRKRNQRWTVRQQNKSTWMF